MIRLFVGHIMRAALAAARAEAQQPREQKAQGRTPKGVGDHEIYRTPEAGAQVRILPGAPRLTCINRSELPLLNRF